jgi:hypothetical protein
MRFYQAMSPFAKGSASAKLSVSIALGYNRSTRSLCRTLLGPASGRKRRGTYTHAHLTLIPTPLDSLFYLNYCLHVKAFQSQMKTILESIRPGIFPSPFILCGFVRSTSQFICFEDKDKDKDKYKDTISATLMCLWPLRA